MRRIEDVILALVIVTILFTPWVVGVMDLAALVFTGHQITYVKWDEGVVFAVAVWPVVAGMVLFMIGGVLCA